MVSALHFLSVFIYHTVLWKNWVNTAHRYWSYGKISGYHLQLVSELKYLLQFDDAFIFPSLTDGKNVVAV